MSFKSNDLLIDVLPVGKLNVFAQPGPGLYALGVAPDDGDEEEDDLLECSQGTAGTNSEPGAAARSGVDLALLQRQMRETLAQADPR